MIVLRTVVVVLVLSVATTAHADCRLATGNTPADVSHAKLLCSSELLSNSRVDRVYVDGKKVDIRIRKPQAIYFIEEVSDERYKNFVKELTKEWNNVLQDANFLVVRLKYLRRTLAKGAWTKWFGYDVKIFDVDIE